MEVGCMTTDVKIRPRTVRKNNDEAIFFAGM
jgi:hypothetical protein